MLSWKIISASRDTRAEMLIRSMVAGVLFGECAAGALGLFAAPQQYFGLVVFMAGSFFMLALPLIQLLAFMKALRYAREIENNFVAMLKLKNIFFALVYCGFADTNYALRLEVRGDLPYDFNGALLRKSDSVILVRFRFFSNNKSNVSYLDASIQHFENWGDACLEIIEFVRQVNSTFIVEGQMKEVAYSLLPCCWNPYRFIS